MSDFAKIVSTSDSKQMDMTKPTENELLKIEIEGLKKHGLNVFNPSQLSDSFRNGLRFGWQARAELADKEIAELQEELVSTKKQIQYWKDFCKKVQKIDFNDYLALQAQINELRKTLEETNTFLDFNIELAQSDEYGNMEPANSYSYELYRYVCFINETLAKTAPQCLIEHDNELLDKVINSYSPDDNVNDFFDKIKALKGYGPKKHKRYAAPLTRCG